MAADRQSIALEDDSRMVVCKYLGVFQQNIPGLDVIGVVVEPVVGPHHPVRHTFGLSAGVPAVGHHIVAFASAVG